MHNKIFTTYDGLSGLAQNPIQPHTVSKEARTCEDCHASRKAIGLGTGFYNSKANGLDIPFELERIVDENGKQIQATNHYDARPFNQEEQERIMRVIIPVYHVIKIQKIQDFEKILQRLQVLQRRIKNIRRY